MIEYKTEQDYLMSEEMYPEEYYGVIEEVLSNRRWDELRRENYDPEYGDYKY